MVKKLQNEANAIITIKSRQEFDTEADSVEIISEGSYYCRNGKYYIMYKDDASMGNSTSMVKVDGECVSIKRMGEYSSYFELKKGKKYSFVYHMPYGDMAMELDARKVEISLGENGGELILCYLLDAGGNVQTNNINISVRKK